MNYDNVNLWFAKDEQGNIVSIGEVDKNNKHNKYYCPMCGSEVIARQGEVNNWCFAHIDKSQCTTESMYHFWIKNKLIQKGDKFIIKSDKEREYICKEILVEQSYTINDKIYRPDITIRTESDETIYFEMEYTNKKKVEEYLDVWIGLNNIVVEVDVKTLINSTINKIAIFKALYYKGKCFNIKKNDELYYNTIGIYKERILSENNIKLKENAQKLDWLWNDIQRYKQEERDIEYISNLIQSIEDEESRQIILEIFKKSNCSSILKEYVEFNKSKIDKILREKGLQNQGIFYDIQIPRLVYERMFGKMKIKIFTKGKIFSKIVDICEIDNLNEIIQSEEIKQIVEVEEIIKEANSQYDYRIDTSNFNLYTFPKIEYIWIESLKQSNLHFDGYNQYFFIEEDNYKNGIEMDKFIDKFIKEWEGHVFSKEEIILLNNIIGKIKDKINDDTNSVVIRIRNLYSLEVCVYNKADNMCRQVIAIKRNNISDINEFYNSLDNLISANIINTINYKYFKENFYDIANEINDRYKQFSFIDWHILNKFNEYDKSIDLYKDGLLFKNIEFNQYKINCTDTNMIKNKIINILSDVIREYIYPTHKEEA